MCALDSLEDQVHFERALDDICKETSLENSQAFEERVFFAEESRAQFSQLSCEQNRVKATFKFAVWSGPCVARVFFHWLNHFKASSHRLSILALRAAQIDTDKLQRDSFKTWSNLLLLKKAARKVLTVVKQATLRWALRTWLIFQTRDARRQSVERRLELATLRCFAKRRRIVERSVFKNWRTVQALNRRLLQQLHSVFRNSQTRALKCSWAALRERCSSARALERLRSQRSKTLKRCHARHSTLVQRFAWTQWRSRVSKLARLFQKKSALAALFKNQHALRLRKEIAFHKWRTALGAYKDAQRLFSQRLRCV